MTSSRAPRHPGRILEEDFLSRLHAGATQAEVADRLGVTRPRLNELIRRKRGVTPDTALRLGRAFGTGPEFWLEAQMAWDLYEVARSRKLMKEVDRIEPLLEASSGPWSGREGDRPGARPEARDVRSAPPAATAAGGAGEGGIAAHYEEFLATRGLLGQARRFARIRAELDGMDARGRLAKGSTKNLIYNAPPPPVDD